MALFVALLNVAAVALFVTVVRDLPGPNAPLDLPWPVWVAAFAISEFLVVHVQLQRDSHSLSLTDLPLVAGLYLVEPAALVAVQVAGVGLTLLLQRRQFGLKFAFNVGAERARLQPGHHRVHGPVAGHRRCRAPGAGSPLWPVSRCPR